MTREAEDNNVMTKPIKATPSRALEILSANLVALAEKEGLTQVGMGVRTGIGQRQAGRIMNKETEPRLDTLSQIAEKLRVPEPVLLCPEMDVRQIPIAAAVRDDVHQLVTLLLELEKSGKLSEQTVTYLKSSVQLATGISSEANIKAKLAAQ